MKIIKSILLGFVLMHFVSTYAYSLPVGYTLSGYIVDAEGIEKNVSGLMIFDDDFTIGETGGSFFNITQFSLITEDFAYEGDSGALWFSNSDLSAPPGADLMWGLTGQINNDRHNWVGEEFHFCNSDGSAYETLVEYKQLAPIIELLGPTYRGGPYANTGRIIATANPVPEPATILLLFSGFMGIAALKRKNK